MKKYLKCTVTTKDGRVYDNPLTLSEARLISMMAGQNKSVLVEVVECSQQQYKQIFG